MKVLDDSSDIRWNDGFETAIFGVKHCKGHTLRHWLKSFQRDKLLM
jgi:hypothetical protein